MSKKSYLDLLDKLKEFPEDALDVDVDPILDELDELWDNLTDDEIDELNALDNDD
jgi:hypothetical protein